MRQAPASFDNFHVYVLAAVTYLGIVLFGYSRLVRCPAVPSH